MQEVTLCLAHTNIKNEFCIHADSCYRNTAFRARQFPEANHVVGTACSSNDYLLFMPISEVK